MKKKCKKKLTIEEYIAIGKSDIFVYAIVTVIFLLISLYICIQYDLYYHLLFVVIMIVSIAERVDTYLTLKKIKDYLIKNNLLEKIGNIDYWNERYYFLTDNYMIIKQNKDIFSFQYSKIERIFKEKNWSGRDLWGYLHIVTNDNEFKVLIYTTVLVGEDYKDISNYLIKKNPNIKVDEIVNKD